MAQPEAELLPGKIGRLNRFVKRGWVRYRKVYAVVILGAMLLPGTTFTVPLRDTCIYPLYQMVTY